MGQWTDLVEARLVDVCENARGATGLGADATARYLVSGRLRRSPYGAPLTDPAYPKGDFDRGYELLMDGPGSDPDPQNPLDSTELVALSIDLQVGYAYGKETPQFATTIGTEVAATAITYVRRRAVNDMHSILKALTFPAITCGDLGSSVTLVECVRRPGIPVATQDLGGGRLVKIATLDLLVEIPTGTRFDP